MMALTVVPIVASAILIVAILSVVVENTAMLMAWLFGAVVVIAGVVYGVSQLGV